MPNVYIIKVQDTSGYIGNQDDENVVDRINARRFHSLLAADSYAIALDMEYPTWHHIVEIL